MRFEDERLHKVSKPWSSEQENLNSGIGWFSGILIAASVVFYFILTEYTDNEWWRILTMSGLFIGLGLVFIIASLATSMDQKDNWRINLPYNRLLYDLLSERVPAMLEEKGYEHWGKSVFLSTVKDKRTGQTLGKGYTIKTSGPHDLDLAFGLTVTRTKYSTSYDLEVVIRNIRMESLRLAQRLQADVHDILEDVEYQKFRQVLREQ